MQPINRSCENHVYIYFNDARFMAVTSCFPILAFLVLIAVFTFENFGIGASIVASTFALAVMVSLRRKILVSIKTSEEELEFKTLAGISNLTFDRIKSSNVYGFSPAFSIVIIIRSEDNKYPLIMFAGALKTSIGGYQESIARVRQMLGAG